MNKISVIMPAYNAAQTIAESINSVISQTFKNWELVIVNDGSKDATEKIISEYIQKDKRIKLINLLKNNGLPNARNLGVENSTGDYIAFLDSDDLWMPEKLKVQADYHTKNKRFLISHTDYDSINANGIIKRPWKNIMTLRKSKFGNLLPTIYYKNVIGVLTVMMKKEVFEGVNGFDIKLWGLEDQDLWIRIAEKGYNFGYINKNLASYRVNPQGMVQNNSKYKKAYKNLISKHYKSHSLTSVLNLVQVHYYRYFGTAYFKRGQYKLANLYFTKSLSFHKFSFIGITTLLYIFYNYFRQITDHKI